MNAGLNGLPGGAQARRVVGLIGNGDGVLGANLSQPGIVATAAQASTLSAAATASVWKELLAISGKGCVNWLAFSANSIANVRFEVEVDGVTIIKTLGVNIASSAGHVVIGGGYWSATPAMAVATFQPIYFNSSVRIKCLSDTTVTVNTLINAEIHA